MRKLVPILATAFAAAGCLDSGAAQTPQDGGTVSVDGALPPISVDGSVPVFGDAGPDAQGVLGLGGGVGAGGVLTQSEHFRLITKTGGEPGGSGVKSSGAFKMVGGVGKPSK
jgi:hypothetical protein